MKLFLKSIGYLLLGLIALVPAVIFAIACLGYAILDKAERRP